MSPTLLTEPRAAFPAESRHRELQAAPEQYRNAGPVWAARAIIIGVAGLLAWYTWGHWGNFQIDNGRELYVPAEILKGKLLYRDLWYMYGPLAPYVSALLFWVLGVHLTILYSFGLSLTIGTALVTFEIARRFELGVLGSMVPPLFLLSESFFPFIRNFVFPYSYAAALGSFLGMVCLYFAMIYVSSGRVRDLGTAALFVSLAILTKQEIGFACLVLLTFLIAAGFLIRRSMRELGRNIAVCLGGLLPAVMGYGWFVWKVSARSVFFENWIQTPGTFFMRTFSKLTLPDQGFRFVPGELLEAVELTALGLALWALAACATISVIKLFRLRSSLPMAIAAFLVVSPLGLAALAFLILFPNGFVVDPSWASNFVVIPLTQAIFPKGIFFLALVLALYGGWRLRTEPRSTLAVQEAGLGVFAALMALRHMMELRPNLAQCALFYNVPVFLVFTILVYRIIRWVCHSTDRALCDLVPRSLLAAEAVLLFILFHPRPELLPVRLTTEFGSFYTRSDVAVLFPQIISFMKTHTRNGRDILVLPEPPSLYVFAGMEAPSRWYSLVPGYVAPEQEPQYINELTVNQVRYILVANRMFVEYGVFGFLQGGYNQQIYHWIMANYAKVGQFGPLPPEEFPPYTVWILERKDLVSQEQNAAARPQEERRIWQDAASQ